MVAGAARHLGVRVPVADDKAVEAEPAFQHVGEQRAVGVHLRALPRGERRHHGQDARPERAFVARQVGGDEIRLRDLRVALVLAVRGTAVGDEVLGGRGHVAGLQEPCALRRSLQALDHGRGEALHERRVLRIALVVTAPAAVLGHRDGRRERPVDAGRGDVLGGRGADPARELGVVGRTERNVVRIEHGTDDVVVAVHGVDAEDHRNRHVPGPRLRGHRPEGPGQRLPVGRRRSLVAVDAAVATGKHRAERVLAKVVGPDRADIDLDELADFFRGRHPREQRVDPPLKRRIGGPCRFELGPRRRVHGGRLGLRRAGERAAERERRGHEVTEAVTGRLAHEP